MRKTAKMIALTVCTFVILTGCGFAVKSVVVQAADKKPQKSDLGLNTETKEATQYTIDANDQVYALLDFDDERELENAQKVSIRVFGKRCTSHCQSKSLEECPAKPYIRPV